MSEQKHWLPENAAELSLPAHTAAVPSAAQVDQVVALPSTQDVQNTIVTPPQWGTDSFPWNPQLIPWDNPVQPLIPVVPAVPFNPQPTYPGQQQDLTYPGQQSKPFTPLKDWFLEQQKQQDPLPYDFRRGQQSGYPTGEQDPQEAAEQLASLFAKTQEDTDRISYSDLGLEEDPSPALMKLLRRTVLVDQLRRETLLLDDGIGAVQLIDCMGDDNAIPEQARISYNGHGRSKTDEENRKLLRFLMASKHFSPFAGAVVKFRFKMPLSIVQQHLR